MTEEAWTYHRNCLIPEGRALPQGVVRVVAAVEYNGGDFCGWQRQSHSPSVQQSVEDALSFVGDEPLTVACAGRTDTGVHATNQVIHFDTTAKRDPGNWIRGANSRLPAAIRLHWAGTPGDGFHARFSALCRTYRYVICNRDVPSALFAGLTTWIRDPLDEQAMDRAAQSLLGERDFTSYRAAGCQSLSPFRKLQRIRVWRQEDLVVEGRVKGRIQTKGDVVVAAGGNVEAAILARNITIQGRVNGNIEAREAVEIQQEGVLIGDCRARTIQIREGARFEGRSDIFE